MKPELDALVDRLRNARSVPWLRVIDDADLDRPPEEEPNPDAVVGPYRWLLQRVGDGVRLTSAGYLPPALVSEAMAALGWQDDWYGKANRENRVLPLLMLRESAQRFGLLRKSRGELLVTKAGRVLVDDSSRLWWHLASRLPDGRSDAERQAGLLYLLQVAAGRPRDDALLADGMSILGWTRGDAGQPLSPFDAHCAAQDTWGTFSCLGLLPVGRSWNEQLPPSEAGVRLARAALRGRPDPSSPASPPPQPQSRTSERAVQLMVILEGIEPAIWRRLVVPASFTLKELHGVLLTAMGWQGHHLHMFDIGGVLYGDVEEIQGLPLGDEDTFTVGQAAERVPEFSYEYDFGDGWEHTIRIEQITDAIGSDTPRVIAGARACPPEDCGGPWGYGNLLEALADPSHEEHETMRRFVTMSVGAGETVDPEVFDLAETNALLQLFDRHTRQRRTVAR